MSEKNPKTLKKMMEKEVSYTFTINPEEQFLRLKPKDRYSQVYKSVFNKLKPLGMYASYELYPEFSPKSGRIHFHGYLKPLDPFNMYLCMPICLSNISYEIDIINDKDTWNDYVLKDSKYMRVQTIARGLKYPMTSYNGYKENGTKDKEETNHDKGILQYYI